MFKIFTQSVKNWFSHDPFTQSAAAAYYTIFSFPGLIIIVMAIAAFAFDEQYVEEEVLSGIQSIMGEQTAENVDKIIESSQRDNRNTWAIVAGLLTLAFGATGLFAHLQNSLNRIYEVDIKKSAGLVSFIKARLISFGVVLIIGFLLLISLSLTAMITLLNEWLAGQFSLSWSLFIVGVNLLVSCFIAVLLFTLIYKILPDAKIEWRAAIWGAIVAAFFFKIGEYAINYYFEVAKPASSFGAAGSLVLLMLWASYSCMILFLGAEFCKEYGLVKYGCKAKPTDIAKRKIT